MARHSVAFWRKTAVLMSMLLCAAVAWGQGGILQDMDTAVESPVAFRPSLPIQNHGCEICVCLKNPCDAAVQAEVHVEDEAGTLLGKKTVSLAPGASGKAILPWTPVKNGYIPLRVRVCAENLPESTAIVRAPVISRPLYFPWFGGQTEAGHALRLANIVLSGDSASHAYWRERGVLPCLWKGVDRSMTAEKYAEYLAEGISSPAKDAAGIMIDEMGGYATEEILASNFFNGLKLYLEKNPQRFTALWICGSLTAPYCNISRNVYRKDMGVNLLMLECYANFQTVEFGSSRRYAYFDQRIAMARQQDVLMNTVMTLAIDGHADKFNLTDFELEDEVRYIRRHAPEMPGLGFFHFDTKTPELIPVAEDLCRRYFVQPVLQAYPEDIQFSSRQLQKGQEIQIYAGVRNLGAMDANNVEVRLLADGKLLQKKTLNLPALKEGDTPRAVPVQATWKAPSRGYHRFRVELHPSGEETVLDGVAEQTLWVR